MSIESDVERLEDEVSELQEKLNLLENFIGVDIDYLRELFLLEGELERLEREIKWCEIYPEPDGEFPGIQHLVESALSSALYAKAIAK